MNEDREIVMLSLAPGSLEELLAGRYVTRVWLAHDTDGYRLSCLDASEPVIEAFQRLLGDEVAGQPPIPHPTPEVASFMEARR